MVFHGIKTERWRGRTLLRILLLGWRGISTFQLPLQLKRCLSCQHSHHQMVPRDPICLGPRVVPGDREVRDICLLMAVGVSTAADHSSTHSAPLNKLYKRIFLPQLWTRKPSAQPEPCPALWWEEAPIFLVKNHLFWFPSISLMFSWGFLLEEVHLILWCWVEPPSATPSILGTTRMCCYSATRAGNADVKEASWDNSSNIFLMIRSSCCHVLHLLPWAKHLNLLHSSSSSMKQGNHSVLIVAISCLGEQ